MIYESEDFSSSSNDDDSDDSSIDSETQDFECIPTFCDHSKQLRTMLPEELEDTTENDNSSSLGAMFPQWLQMASRVLGG